MQGGDPAKDPRVVKKMAQLMMQGAVMLAETCPIDGLPLFRLRSGEVVCPVHGRVMLVSSEGEAREAEVDAIIESIVYTAAGRAKSGLEKGEPDEVMKWLQVLETAERIRSLRRSSGDQGNERESKQ